MIDIMQTTGDRHGRLLVALGAAGLATFAQLYALQGLLPDISVDLEVSHSTVALTISAATFGLAVSLLPWAAVASRFGITRAMSIALLAASGLGLLVAVSPDFPALLALRALEGVALGGVPALAVALVGRDVAVTHRAQVVGVYIAGTTIGGLSGRLLAGAVASFSNWRVAEAVVCGLALVCSITFVVLVPRRPAATSVRIFTPAAIRRVLPIVTTPRLLVRYGQAFLLLGSSVTVYSFLSFRLQVLPFLLPVTVANLVFLAYLGGTVTSSAAGVLARRFGSRTVFLVATGGMLVAVLLSLLDSLPAIIVALVIFTAGFFLAHTLASSAVVEATGVDAPPASSLYNVAYYLGSAIVGLIGGLAFGAGGWPLLVVAVGIAVALTFVSGLVRDPPASATRV